MLAIASPQRALTGQTTVPFSARNFQCTLLRSADRLPLALPAIQLSALADRLLPFPALARSPVSGIDSLLPCERLSASGWAGMRSHHRCGIRVKTVEESAGVCGYDAHKHIKGRKRHILVDTLGLPLSIYVTPADVHDTRGARCLLAGLAPLVPRLKKIWADGASARARVGRLMQSAGRLGPRSRRTCSWHARLQHPATQMDSRANFGVAFSQ